MLSCYKQTTERPSHKSTAACTRLQRPQQRAVEVQRQQRVNDLHRVLLKDEARVKVGCVRCPLRAPTHNPISEALSRQVSTADLPSKAASDPL